MTHTNVNTVKVDIFPQVRNVISLLSICIAFGLFTWSLNDYHPSSTIYGPRAIYSMLFLSIVLALLGRVILIRMLGTEIAQADISPYDLRSTWRLLFLIDITAPLYLGAGVL